MVVVYGSSPSAFRFRGIASLSICLRLRTTLSVRLQTLPLVAVLMIPAFFRLFGGSSAHDVFHLDVGDVFALERAVSPHSRGVGIYLYRPCLVLRCAKLECTATRYHTRTYGHFAFFFFLDRKSVV